MYRGNTSSSTEYRSPERTYQTLTPERALHVFCLLATTAGAGETRGVQLVALLDAAKFYILDLEVDF